MHTETRSKNGQLETYYNARINVYTRRASRPLSLSDHHGDIEPDVCTIRSETREDIPRISSGPPSGSKFGNINN